jgi:hypothetical protein
VVSAGVDAGVGADGVGRVVPEDGPLIETGPRMRQGAGVIMS